MKFEFELPELKYFSNLLGSCIIVGIIGLVVYACFMSLIHGVFWLIPLVIGIILSCFSVHLAKKAEKHRENSYVREEADVESISTGLAAAVSLGFAIVLFIFA